LKRIKEKLEISIVLNDGIKYSPKFILILTIKPKKCIFKNILNRCDFYSYIEFLEEYAKQKTKALLLFMKKK